MKKVKDWIIKKLGGYTEEDYAELCREESGRIAAKDATIVILNHKIAEYEKGAITLYAERVDSKDHPDWAVDHLCHELASSESFKNCVNIEILPNPYPDPRDYSVKYRATVQVAPKM